MWTGYAGEVCHAQGHTGRADTVHIREQAQVERDIVEDGSQDSGSMEDEARGLQGSCPKHLHEAWGIDGFDHAYDTGADRGCDALDLGVGHCHGADMGLDRIRLMIPDVIMPLIGIVLISTIMVLMT